MTTMKKTKVTEIHKFMNLETGKTCKVISTRIEDCKFHVTFKGWNPFPCWSMETSWNPFVDWMTANRWLEIEGVTRIIKEEVKEK